MDVTNSITNDLQNQDSVNTTTTLIANNRLPATITVNNRVINTEIFLPDELTIVQTYTGTNVKLNL